MSGPTDGLSNMVKAMISSVIVTLGEDVMNLAMVISGHNSDKKNNFVSEYDLLDSIRFQILSESGSAKDSVRAIKSILDGSTIAVSDISERASEIVEESVSAMALGTSPPTFVSEKILQDASLMVVDEASHQEGPRTISCTCKVCVEVLSVRSKWENWVPEDPWENYFVSIFSSMQVGPTDS